MHAQNPFIYAIPVPAERLIDRQRELSTLFSGLTSAQSIAIVGGPRVGKTSLLQYVARPRSLHEWLGERAERLIIVEMDLYRDWLSQDRTPEHFWRYVLAAIPGMEHTIRRRIEIAEDNHYSSGSLADLFETLNYRGWRIVLLIDEFDVLVGHPNFATAEFLSGLRSVAIRGKGFQLITASIASPAEMNELSIPFHPRGSPLFNYFVEVHPDILDDDSVSELLDQALAGNAIQFTKEDRAFITWLSGCHPFRVQVAGACLLDVLYAQLSGPRKYMSAARLFCERTSEHFDTVWRRGLDDPARIALVVVTTLELGATSQRPCNRLSEIMRMQSLEPALSQLEKTGLVGRASCAGQESTERPAAQRDEQAATVAGGCIWWLADSIVSGAGRISNFDGWLRAQEAQSTLLDRGQWRMLRDCIAAIRRGASGSLDALIRRKMDGMWKTGIEKSRIGHDA